MKKLNITKDKFTESKYFTTKYGKLEYVSESGKIYKTSKGHLLKFMKESVFGGYDTDELEDELSKVENEGKKYKLSDKPFIMSGDIYHRIIALKDFGDVKKGDVGGLVMSEDNLSQEGDCWVYDFARVYEDARVYGNARIDGSARISGKAKIFGNAYVSDMAFVGGNAQVYDRAHIYRAAQVYGSAKVFGSAEVFGEARVCGKAKVYDNAKVYDLAQVRGYAKVFGNSTVRCTSYVDYDVKDKNVLLESSMASNGKILKFNESQNDVTIDDFKRMYGKNAAEALIKYCDVKNKDAESVINGSDADMARFENWAKKVLHVDIYDKFSGYDYDSDLDDSRSEIDESSNDDMDKEFKYKGITITRYDYESLPYPMAASQVDDRTMMNIAKEIYYLFIDNGWSDMDVQKYGADIDEIADDNPEMDMFHDEWWTYMEKAAIKYGMPYYEDMDDI